MDNEQIAQELGEVLSKGQYVIVEMNDHPHDTQFSGYFVEVGERGLTLDETEGDTLYIPFGDINCVMDDATTVLWPRGAK